MTAGGASASRASLALRASVLRAIRSAFDRMGLMEVQTPVRVRTPALEPHIDAEPCGDAYLRTSPELHMKRLLAAGHDRIYQIGPCFRRGERGPLHHPEHTLLEWYRVRTDYLGILEDTREALRAVAAACGRKTIRHGDATADLDGAWTMLGVSEAYRKWAGWDPATDWEEDRFDQDWVERIEPALRRINKPVVILDYPAPAAALSRLKPSDPLRAERWELILCGVEIANAYTELTDASEQRRRFEACAASRAARGRAVYPLDEAFLAALEQAPPCGGCALGVDRLAMLMAGDETLDGVLAFRGDE